MLFVDIALMKGLYCNNDSKTYLIESDDVVVAFVVGVARRLGNVHTSVQDHNISGGKMYN